MRRGYCTSTTATALRLAAKPCPRNSHGYTLLLQSHSSSKHLSEIHSQVITSGLERDRFVATCLVARYAMLGLAGVAAARQVFDRAPHRDAFLWNVMLRGYAIAGPPTEAVALFARMHATQAPANHYTYPFVIKACAAVGDARVGQPVHALVVRAGMDYSDIFVSNALVAFYAKCGDIATARKVFDGVTRKDTVSWNSMIAGYAQSGRSEEAIALLRSMPRCGEACRSRPDHVTFVAVLPACAASAAVHEGMFAHWLIAMYAALASGLIAMYAACGRLHTARALFDRVPGRSRAVYSSMIQAYGSHGHSVEALTMFGRMLANGIAPDGICFVSVLSACAHGRLVDDGLRVFDMMGEHGVDKGQVHYACMVDLFGRAGQLAGGLGVVNAMPFEPGKDVWGALLGACRLHNDVELAKHAAERLLVLDPGNAGRYAALAQTYDDAGRWDDASRVRRTMGDRGGEQATWKQYG